VRVLFVGDVVGRPGRDAVEALLPGLRERLEVDACVVNGENIARFARILRAGGEFHFATDWANYAEWTLLRLSRSRDFIWTAERADDWRRPWAGFSSTRYEAKAVREGRAPTYLVFQRT